MKDYSINEEERKKFILNYTENEDNLTINFANGSNYAIPNTNDNKNKVESKMIEQVSNCDNKKSKLKRSNIGNILLILLIFSLTSFAMFKFSNFDIVDKIISSLSTGSVFNIPMFIKIINNSKLLKDIEKNEFFVSNQEVINRGLNNTNVLVNSDVKLNEEDKTITVNDIDHSYSFDDLKTIVDNSEIEEFFEFDTFEFVEPKIRKRKR